MADLIIIRLAPRKPTTGATFTSYLTNLKIVVSDMSFAKPTGAGNPIGTAFFNPGDPTSTIVQHRMPPPPLLPVIPAAVATAVVVIQEPPGYAEYGTADVRLTITRGTQTVVDRSLNYNVAVDAGGVVPAGHNPLAYAGLGPVALYLTLPDPTTGLDPSQAFVDIPADGTPPNFDDLLANVTKVLNKDPTLGSYDLRALTPQQCRHIASEIVWNRSLNPLPSLPNSLEELYTLPDAASNDTDRKKFEADLMTYSTVNSAQADVLAKYVFALSSALAIEKKTIDAAHAGFAFPVLPGIGPSGAKVAETDVILS